jgi:hypothetical protein
LTTLTLQFANNASTTLAADITAASSSFQVVSGGGSLFPSGGGQNAFYVTLVKNGAPNTREICLVETRFGDNFLNVFRGVDGTTALSWNAGDTVACFPTAGEMNYFVQQPQAQAQAGNWALDIGTANAYVVHLTPALNASTIGMPIRWFAGHTNTGASTFNDGITQAPLVALNGTPLAQFDIIGGSFYETVWNGAVFILTNVRDISFSQVFGSVSNAQVPQSAVTQWQAALAIAFSQLTGQLQNGQIAGSIALPGNPTTTTQAVNDTSTKIATTAFANPGVDRNIPGFFTLPSGYVVNIGTANPAGGAVTVTLDHAYSNASSWVVTAINFSSGPTQVWLDPAGKTASQFVLHNTGGSSLYIAVGF